jgi:hypothetical protein
MPLQGPGLLISSVIIFHRRYDSLDEWSARRKAATWNMTIQTQNKHIHTPNIHALSGIRNHDPGVRASENSSSLRLRGHCDRQIFSLYRENSCSFWLIFGSCSVRISIEISVILTEVSRGFPQPFLPNVRIVSPLHHDHFNLNPLRFIFILSSNHSALCSTASESVV